MSSTRTPAPPHTKTFVLIFFLPTASPNYQKMERTYDEASSAGGLEAFRHVGGNVGILPGWRLDHRRFRLPIFQRLPREIRVLLSEDHPADMRAIADKADRLIAMHVPQGQDTCATVSADKEPEQDLVAAKWHGSATMVLASAAALFAASQPRPPFLAL